MAAGELVTVLADRCRSSSSTHSVYPAFSDAGIVVSGRARNR
jgi:hypothetical protein